MPRGRKKRFKLHFNIKPETLKSILAVFLVLFAVLGFISFFATDYALNSKINGMFKSLFGMASLLFPLLIFDLALFFIESIKWKIKEPRIFLGMLLAIVVLAGFLHLFYGVEKGSGDAKDGEGGGIIGYSVAKILVGTISKFGAMIALLAGFTISAFLIFDISLNQVMDRASKYKEAASAFKAKRSEGKAENNVQITSGADAITTEQNDNGELPFVHNEEIASAPSFEIIDSMSEPQDKSSGYPDAAALSGTPLVNPHLPYANKVWDNPPLDLLVEPVNAIPDSGDTKERAKIIKDTLKSFGINVEVQDVQAGPAVTQYSLEAETGTKISKIASLQYDIAMALSSPSGSVRIEAPIPGKSLIGIEVPNNTRVVVSFKSLFTSDPMKALKSKLGVVLGKDVGGTTRVYDIGRMPHLLVAGATGSGKSVFLHSLIFSMLYRASPHEVKFIMMDPKRTELVHYNDIPHLLTPVITDVEKAPAAFKWAVEEMNKRYKLFESAKARNIEAYNEKSGFQALPYIIIIVDELAEIMIVDPAAVEKSIIRVAQLARATGIHLVLAVQRPSTNIITGLIKANIPCRVAFNVASQIDSRVIIDQPGAEKLLGKGDMLFVPPDVQKPVRLQGSFITDKEINNLVSYLKAQGMPPEYKQEIFEMNEKVNRSVAAGGGELDEHFEEAKEIVLSTGKASASLLQRRLAVGYARAARIIDELEQKGIIGPASGSKPRGILVPRNKPNEFHEEVDTIDGDEFVS